MRCGLYGKLPTKRDFVAIKAPREFLAVWEPWMQSGLSASRHALGDSWQQTFLTAPIWRFWLGEELCCGSRRLRTSKSSVNVATERAQLKRY